MTARSAARLAVMLSGSGRTLVNLVKHIREGSLPASIELVIASRECLGAERSRAAGLPTRVVPGVIPAAQLAALLHQYSVDLVVLAGYLKFIEVPPSFAGRIVNIHPALLPDFGGHGMYGDRVHAAVLRSGARTSGCTVHLVDDAYDHGRILLQRTCPVAADDTPHSLAARVFELECQAYPEAIRRLIESNVTEPQPTVTRPTPP